MYTDVTVLLSRGLSCNTNARIIYTYNDKCTNEIAIQNDVMFAVAECIWRVR